MAKWTRNASHTREYAPFPLLPPPPFPSSAREHLHPAPVHHLVNLDLHLLLRAPRHRGRRHHDRAPHVDHGLLRDVYRVLDHRPAHVSADEDGGLDCVEGMPEHEKHALFDRPVSCLSVTAAAAVAVMVGEEGRRGGEYLCCVCLGACVRGEGSERQKRGGERET